MYHEALNWMARSLGAHLRIKDYLAVRCGNSRGHSDTVTKRKQLDNG